MVKHDAHVKKYKKRVNNAKYYSKHKDELREYYVEYSAGYYAANKDKVAAKNRKYAAVNKDSVSALKRRHYDANRERYAEQAAAYRKRNVASYLARDTLARLLGNGMVEAMTGITMKHAEGLCGYTNGDLIAHLEALFTDGMSWENRSEWHIDHIKPVAAFMAEGT
ncbi:MAG: hypothetical protein ACRDC4_13260, partial [Plesiomonas sp.]